MMVVSLCQSGFRGLNDNTPESIFDIFLHDYMLMSITAYSEYEARVELLGPQPGGDR